MEITYLGHSSFRLRGRNASLVTDPYDASMVGMKFSPTSADIVTISHDHKDHNQKNAVKDVHMVVEGPGEYEIMGVSVIGIGSYHDNKKGEIRGKNTIYIIEMDKLRIVHLGDLGHTLPEDTLEDLGKVDILFVPVGGEYTINSTEAAEITQTIEPSITIPMHYYMEGMSQETFGKLAKVDDFIRELGVTPQYLDKLSIKKEDLTEEQKVIILEKK